MARRDTYVTTAALLAVLAGTSWVSCAVTRGREAYGIEVSSVDSPATEPSAPEAPATPEAPAAPATPAAPEPLSVLLSVDVGAISASAAQSARHP